MEEQDLTVFGMGQRMSMVHPASSFDGAATNMAHER